MVARNKPAVALRPMLPEDGQTLATLCIESIDELTGDDYDANQRAAWAASAEDAEAFGRRLQGWLTLVASIAGEPAGFAALEGRDHIKMLYVHPSAARQGVAATLCDALERLAAARGAKTITVDASDTAQGFFARRGYQAKSRKTLTLGDEWLGSTGMEKSLAPAVVGQAS